MDYKIPDVKISKRNKEVFANCKISVGDKKLAFREEKTLMVATVLGKFYEIKIPEKGGEIKHF